LFGAIKRFSRPFGGWRRRRAVKDVQTFDPWFQFLVRQEVKAQNFQALQQLQQIFSS
jgi:hypothetical protein